MGIFLKSKKNVLSVFITTYYYYVDVDLWINVSTKYINQFNFLDGTKGIGIRNWKDTRHKIAASEEPALLLAHLYLLLLPMHREVFFVLLKSLLIEFEFHNIVLISD